MYAKSNNDNITEAVRGLDIFTKNWCMNCKETQEKNEPTFRCNECLFKSPEGGCFIKIFAHKHKHDYPLDNFGSMGSKLPTLECKIVKI